MMKGRKSEVIHKSEVKQAKRNKKLHNKKTFDKNVKKNGTK